MICISIGKPHPAVCKDMLQDAEIAEIRLDGADLSDAAIGQIFSLPLDLIATCRPGGSGSGANDDERKRKLITAIEAGAAYVDIEIEAANTFKEEIIRVAWKKECRVIISYHNYEKTPPPDELDCIIERCFAAGADIAKLACMASSEADAARILALYQREDRHDLIALAMGEKGMITRVAAPFLGAPFTFAAPDGETKTAPGQLDKTSLETIYGYLLPRGGRNAAIDE